MTEYVELELKGAAIVGTLDSYFAVRCGPGQTKRVDIKKLAEAADFTVQPISFGTDAKKGHK